MKVAYLNGEAYVTRVCVYRHPYLQSCIICFWIVDVFRVLPPLPLPQNLFIIILNIRSRKTVGPSFLPTQPIHQSLPSKPRPSSLHAAPSPHKSFFRSSVLVTNPSILRCYHPFNLSFLLATWYWRCLLRSLGREKHGKGDALEMDGMMATGARRWDGVPRGHGTEWVGVRILGVLVRERMMR